MGQIRFEEYAPLGDFLMTSFVRDQAAIAMRFPKLDAGYVTAFETKLDKVKSLEGTLKLTDEQKKATAELYAEAAVVNMELNFFSSYLKDAGLPTEAVTQLKKSLSKSNIEGALLQMKALKQYAEAHQAELEAEGMDAGYPNALETHRVSMAAKNALQNSVMDSRKQLVEHNKAEYKALYDCVKTVAEKGKLIFKGTVIEDQYNITKLLARMRAPKHDGDGPVTP
ncbi:hypothetical protein [Flavobacterium sp. XGLA_31]|uniref:hypothetical protein n=1 Tax=Flavobacterium sp. XGLA_31 TaxID=3447666 RepID=UPI003F3685E3